MKIPLTWLKDYVETDKSAKELAASFTQLGLMLDKPLDDKNILDLEHRMDRSDWLSLIGCARDLSAYENIPLKLPKGYGKAGKVLDAKSAIAIKVETPAVRRFATRVFKGIKVGNSPKWLSDRLTAYGIDSINNIVDITNFVMVEYGQPMHAQDTAKLKGSDITIRQAKKDEHLTTLLGTEVKLDHDAFVLTSGGEVTVIGGIVGGKNTGVTDSTTDIILDAGNYDSRIIRKVSRKLKIINETVSRYDKFLDPRLIDIALARATDLILEIAGGTYYANHDYYPNPVTPRAMTLRLSRLHLLSGMDIGLAKAKHILKALDYSIVEEGSDSLTVEIPYFRTDVEVEDDLIADILRIHNYEHIPAQALSTPVPQDLTTDLYRFQDQLCDLLLACGAHEHITSSLVTSVGESEEVKLANALSADQNALRLTLLSGLYTVASTYRKHKLEIPAIFEIGKVFAKIQGKFLEQNHLTVLASNPQDNLATLLNSLGIQQYLITKSGKIQLKATCIGVLTPDSYTLYPDQLMQHARPYTGIISEFSHHISLDLSLIATPNLRYADIIQVIDTIKGTWTQLTCKSMTKHVGQHNYLLTLTWPAGSKTVVAEKELILQTLKQKLQIHSKS